MKIGDLRKCRGCDKNPDCKTLVLFPKVRCNECWQEWKVKLH
jgi:hypothetical protein